ncbi:MAG: hypothetical protein U5L72_15260 [Bacteroidales bacterium]|nr:hypothetical protein [Bacteroidales bacterium]
MLPKVLFNFERQPSRHRKLPGEESVKVRAASVIYGGYNIRNRKERSTYAIDLSNMKSGLNPNYNRISVKSVLNIPLSVISPVALNGNAVKYLP